MIRARLSAMEVRRAWRIASFLNENPNRLAIRSRLANHLSTRDVRYTAKMIEHYWPEVERAVDEMSDGTLYAMRVMPWSQYRCGVVDKRFEDDVLLSQANYEKPNATRSRNLIQRGSTLRRLTSSASLAVALVASQMVDRNAAYVDSVDRATPDLSARIERMKAHILALPDIFV